MSMGGLHFPEDKGGVDGDVGVGGTGGGEGGRGSCDQAGEY